MTPICRNCAGCIIRHYCPRSQNALADLDYIKRRLSALCAVQEQEATDE